MTYGNLKVSARSLATKLDYGYCSAPDVETILEHARDALERPSDSYWHDDELWETHTLMFHSAPDSDDTISASNYRSILRDMSGLYARYPGAVESATIGHWTYSHFDCIKVRVAYANGEIHPAFVDALQIALALRDNYPLYDDSDHSELEMELWDNAIAREVDWSTRETELEDISGLVDSDGMLIDALADTFRADVTNYLHSENAQLYGYHECGYIPEETMQSAISYATRMIGAPRPHATQETLPGLEN